MAIYLNRLHFGNNNKSSLINAFYVFRWGHHVIHYNSLTKRAFVQQAFGGYQRLSNNDTVKKEPIRPDIIENLHIVKK